MDKINRHNYEAFLLDFIEGNLSKTERKELFVFLRDKPNLKIELQDLEATYLQAENVSTEGSFKSTLVREEESGLKQIDYLMIASLEGMLNEEEQKQLSEILEINPDLLDDVNTFSKTKIQVQSISYPDKERLLKQENKLIYWPWYAAAAAVTMAMVLLNIDINQSTYQPYQLSVSFSLENKLDDSEETHFANSVVVLDQIDSKPSSIDKEKKPKKPSSIFQKDLRKSNPNEKKTLEKWELMPKKEIQQFALAQSSKEPIKGNIKSVSSDKVLALPNKEKEVMQINEFALHAIRKEVLKGKTFSETIVDEMAALTNQNINIINRKNNSGKTEEFALQIGKFSFSQKK